MGFDKVKGDCCAIVERLSESLKNRGGGRVGEGGRGKGGNLTGVSCECGLNKSGCGNFFKCAC